MLNQIDLSRIDLNLLVLFETVFGERHVGRAAQRLSLSPSAVSHGLGRLRRLLNDPLFMRTPKGVVPTDRAIQLSASISDALSRVREIVSAAVPFDPATSARRFTIGAPDGVSAVFLPPLLDRLRTSAPGIDISVRQILPAHREVAADRVWREAFADLEARSLDLAVIPSDAIPARFHQRLLYQEDFVIAMRSGNPFAGTFTLERYCEAQHLVVSLAGDPHGFVDEALLKMGRARRIALTVPNFMFALAALADSDLISAIPRRFTVMHGPRFGVVHLEPPLSLPGFRLNAIAPNAAMADAGLAWLLDCLDTKAIRHETPDT